MKQGTFLFLGTGASAGVPIIGCKCSICTSASLKNKRLRPSGLIRIDHKALLIDIGPDFRTQALKYGVEHLDGLLLTHTHYDHIAGIDELRIFNTRQKKDFPCLLSQESLDDIRKRYDYLFLNKGSNNKTKIAFTTLPEGQGKVDFLGIEVGYCSYMQGSMKVNGFRFGDFAYVSDIQQYDDAIFDMLQGVHTLVLSTLKPEKSPFHLSFEQAVEISKKVGAQKTWLTHLSHFGDHDAMDAMLPEGVKVAYDGLLLEFA